jgi:hypothetical protein
VICDLPLPSHLFSSLCCRLSPSFTNIARHPHLFLLRHSLQKKVTKTVSGAGAGGGWVVRKMGEVVVYVVIMYRDNMCACGNGDLQR